MACLLVIQALIVQYLSPRIFLVGELVLLLPCAWIATSSKIRVQIATTPIEQPNVFKFECASRCFHEYRKIWVPRLRQKLSILYEKSNVYDLYAIALARSTQATVTGIDVVGHLPREISRFCKFFYDYGGELSAFP